MHPGKFVVLVVLGVAAAVAGLIGLRRSLAPVPPPPMHVVSGSILDGDRAVTVLDVNRLYVAGPTAQNVVEGRASLRMPGGTRFLVTGLNPPIIHLESGRLWVVAGTGAEVTVTAFSLRATVADGACELVAWEDKDHFKNTTVRAWHGRTRVQGGPGLKGTAELRYGQSVLVDDAALHEVSAFDATSPDAWQAWNRDLR